MDGMRLKNVFSLALLTFSVQPRLPYPRANQRRMRRGENVWVFLVRYQGHTLARVRPVGMDEPCPTLLCLSFAACSKPLSLLLQEKWRENKIEAPGEMLSLPWTKQEELSCCRQRPQTWGQPVLLLSLLNKIKLSTIPWLDSFFRKTQKNALIQPCWSPMCGFALLCCCITLLPGRKVIPTAPMGRVLLPQPATAPLSCPAWQTGTCWAAKNCSCSWAPA